MPAHKKGSASNMPKKQHSESIAPATFDTHPSLLPSSKKDKKILQEKAALLAKKHDQQLSTDEHDSYLLFRLGPSELYGIQWRYLVEVMPGKPPTIVPGAPACIAGVFNRRGKIHCVLNIDQLIGLPDYDQEESGEMIVVHAAGMMVGILVSELLGSQSYDPAHLEAALSSHKNEGHGSYVHGIDQGKITLLNLETLLQDPMLNISHTNSG